MKHTIKKIIEHSGMEPKLARGIIKQCGGMEQWEYAMDTGLNGGAQAGVSGFIYYTETVGFFRKHKQNIVMECENMARDLGIGVLEFVQGFDCIKGDYAVDEIGKALYGRYNEEYDMIYNALAWFALETLVFRCDGMDE